MLLSQRASSRCLKSGKNVVPVMEDEKQEGEKKIVSISLISVVQTKVGEQFGGRMYVEIEVEVNKFQVTMNTGADNVYIAKELVEEINLPYKKERAT